MTPVQALLAGIFAAILFAAGAFIAARIAGGRPHDLVPLLSLGRTPFSWLCFLAAWGAIVFGALGALTAFVAFIAPEEDDDPRLRRRGFPKSAPLVLIALGLGLVWFALHCAAANATPPVAAPITPQSVEPSPAPLAEPQKPAPAEPAAPPAPVIPAPVIPAPVVDAMSFSWPYRIPLMRADAEDAAARAIAADGEDYARFFCGKAWIAVTGSASEEGPLDRNIRRAELRAAAAKSMAEGWLRAHGECGSAIVFGLALGQHAPVVGADIEDGGAATAYQRRVLIVSRAHLDGEAISLSAARAELDAFIADPDALSALFAGRSFDGPPEILSP